MNAHTHTCTSNIAKYRNSDDESDVGTHTTTKTQMNRFLLLSNSLFFFSFLRKVINLEERMPNKRHSVVQIIDFSRWNYGNVEFYPLLLPLLLLFLNFANDNGTAKTIKIQMNVALANCTRGMACPWPWCVSYAAKKQNHWAHSCNSRWNGRQNNWAIGFQLKSVNCRIYATIFYRKLNLTKYLDASHQSLLLLLYVLTCACALYAYLPFKCSIVFITV